MFTCFASRVSARAFSAQAGARHAVRKARLGSFDIGYNTAGAGDKALLLLPGDLGSDFTPQLDALPRLLPGHTIVAWDPPGYGKSWPPARKYHLENNREDAELAHALMAHLDFASYAVAGWCDGGRTGVLMASLFPGSVRRLVLWGAKTFITEKDVAVYRAIQDTAVWPESARQPQESVYGVEGLAQLWWDCVESKLAIFRERQGNICNEHLERVQCPTLILQGMRDPLVTAEHVECLRRGIRTTELHEFAQGSHHSHLQFAAEFNERVARFLLADVDEQK